MIQLTQEQTKIVQHQQGNALVTAVPGSGKTKTLLHRIEHLVAQGVEPSSILVLMFNRDAKNEFYERLISLETPHLEWVQVKTFHSFGYQCLREWWNHLGLPHKSTCQTPNYEATILRLINRNLKKLKEAHAVCSLIKPRDVKESLSWIQANWPLLAAEELNIALEQSLQDQKAGVPELDTLALLLAHQVYFDLENWLEEKGKISFHQMINLPLDYAENDTWTPPSFLGISHLLVDEYQDSNPRQVALLQSLIVASNASIMVVGDPDQCIYEWRFATPEVMNSTRFQEFGDFTAYPLTQTFRFGSSLCHAANQLIAHNLDRGNQGCRSEQFADTEISLCFSESSLMQSLDEWSQDLTKSSAGLLFRRWDLCISYQVEFSLLGLNFHVLRHEKHFLNMDIFKVFNAWIQVAGKRYGQLCRAARIALSETYGRICSKEVIDAVMAKVSRQPLETHSLTQQEEAVVAVLYRQILAFSQKSPRTSLDEIFSLFLKLDPVALLLERAQDEDEVQRQILAFKSFIASSGQLTLAQCLERFATLAENQKSTQGFTLGSIHSAKGLEWDHVAMIGVEDSTFILSDAHNQVSQKELEEQRRLFYVGMTRARKKLLLSGPAEEQHWCRFVREAGLLKAEPTTAELLLAAS